MDFDRMYSYSVCLEEYFYPRKIYYSVVYS